MPAFARPHPTRRISVVVRRDAGPLEFLIDGRTIAVEP